MTPSRSSGNSTPARSDGHWAKAALAGLLDEDLLAEVLSELNVKSVEIAERSGRWSTTTIRPNLPVLGPRFGKLLGKVRQALGDLDEDAVAAFEETGTLTIDLDGREIELGTEDVLVSRSGKEGYAVAAGGGYVAALDTHITPELEAEGLRRELVNRIQNHRKQEGYEVTTRIRAAISGPADLAQAVKGTEEEIAREVLAIELSMVADRSGLDSIGGKPRQVDLLGREVWIATTPVEQP